MNLELRHVTVDFRMKRTLQALRALEDVSFKVRGGEFVTIVGPSGCGKTTLLNVILGLTSPSQGRALIDGQGVGGTGGDRAMVFQSPSLLPWRTVLGNVVFGLEIERTATKEARERALHYVQLLGLGGFEDSYPSEISEGMRQRVNLARALAIEPELLLLDEPFASLDALTRNHMQMELQSIWHETARTAVFVTHNISEAVFLGDFVIALSARPGKVKKIIRVDLPRPRSLHSKRTPEFNHIEEQLWDLLEHEPPQMETSPHLADGRNA